MVVTWDLGATLPCCQSFTKQINGGDVLDRSIIEAWNSLEFESLRKAHRNHTWDAIPMCVTCPLTKYVATRKEKRNE